MCKDEVLLPIKDKLEDRMRAGKSNGSNPYTPRSEIEDLDLFAGRDGLLEDIEYTISQAAGAQPKYLNVAVSGEPGIGKSSLCNCIVTISEDYGLTPIRIDLEKDDVKNPSKLFKRIHRKFLQESRLGSAKLRWRDWTRPLKHLIVNIPGAPVQFNLTPGAGFEERSKKAFGKAVKMISDPVLLILDNTHNFIESPTTLSKLHNVFSDLEGVQLILAGDSELYEQTTNELDHVWRKFEFYSIGLYSSVSQTEEALTKPIQSESDIKIPDETVKKVHEITAGHPAEIHLLGYYMYKEARKEGSQLLQLTPPVLSQTLDQLVHRQPSIDTSLVEKIRNLEENKIRTLVATIEAPPMTKEGLVNYLLLRYFDEIRPTEYTTEKIQKIGMVEELLEEGLLIQTEQGIIEFSGDSYDQMFAKLSLYTRDSFDIAGGRAVLTEDDLIAHIHYELIDKTVLSGIKDCHSHYKPDPTPRSNLYSLKVEGTPETESLEIEPPRLSAESLGYEVNYNQREITPPESEGDRYGREQTCIIGISLDWREQRYIVIIHAESERILEDVKKRLEYVESRIKEIGLTIEWDTAFSRYHQAVDLKQEGNLEAALEEFQTAVDINPEFSPAWYQQGLIYEEQGNFEEAESAFDEALSYRSDWVNALIARCRVLWEQEKTDEFIRTAESVCGILPDDSQFLYECSLRLELDDPHKAVDFAERAYSSDESLLEALVCAQACTYKEKRFDESIDYYQRILEHPNDLTRRNELVSKLYYIGALVENKQFDKAYQETTSISDGLMVDTCALNYAAGTFLMEQQRWGDAIDKFSAALDSTEDRMTEFDLQQSYMMCSQAKENRTWVDYVNEERENHAYSSILQSVGDRSPLNSHILQKKAECLLHKGEYDAAFEVCEEGLSSYPRDKFANLLHIGKVQALSLKEEWRDTIEYMEDIDEDIDSSIQGLYIRSVSHAHLDQRSKGLECLREAIEIDEDKVKSMAQSEFFPDLGVRDPVHFIEGQKRGI